MLPAGDAGGVDGAVAARVFVEVTLVLFLGKVVVDAGADLGGDVAKAGGFELGGVIGNDFTCDIGLLLGLGEDAGAVLGADVVALAVTLGGVVGLEGDFHEVLEGDLGGIIDDADDLGVAGAAGADLAVGGVRGVAAGEADGGGGDAGGLSKELFDAPEATETEEDCWARDVEKRRRVGMDG